jgi:ADP-ribosyl-[dinitrogen reductase] hydrolase
VAAIAGSLIGAAHGVSTVPASWRRIIHGWPGMNYRDLLGLGIICASGVPSAQVSGWPLSGSMPGTHENVFVQHPHDDGVWLGSLAALDTLPANIDAVISLCRVGTEQIPLGAGAGTLEPELIEFWLIDEAGHNLDTAFVLTDAANTVASLRAEGKNVLIHCVAAHNRTPAAGIAYSMLHKGLSFEQASAEVRAALPNPQHNAEFEQVLKGFES